MKRSLPFFDCFFLVCFWCLFFACFFVCLFVCFLFVSSFVCWGFVSFPSYLFRLHFFWAAFQGGSNVICVKVLLCEFKVCVMVFSVCPHGFSFASP